jgi:hypothetical protein
MYLGCGRNPSPGCISLKGRCYTYPEIKLLYHYEELFSISIAIALCKVSCMNISDVEKITFSEKNSSVWFNDAWTPAK